MIDKDFVTHVTFGGERTEVEFRISEFASRAEDFLGSRKKFSTGDLAMAMADCFVLGTIRERERVAKSKGADVIALVKS